MSSTQVEKLREKLVNKLAELFQLNQPDLDFGFYRIMHAKADQVQQFIDNDLLSIIGEAFGEADGYQVAEAKANYEAAIQQAKDFGVPNPEDTKPVQDAKAAYDAARESGSHEAQVYDHLYRFFERYYDDGDFISRRYYTGKPQVPPRLTPFPTTAKRLNCTGPMPTNITLNLLNTSAITALIYAKQRRCKRKEV